MGLEELESEDMVRLESEGHERRMVAAYSRWVGETLGLSFLELIGRLLLLWKRVQAR